MLPPIEPANLHGAVRPGRGGVVFEQGAQAFPDNSGIFICETSLLGQLDIDRAFNEIQAETHYMLAAHGVRASLFAGFAIDTFGNLIPKKHFSVSNCIF